MVLNIR